MFNIAPANTPFEEFRCIEEHGSPNWRISVGDGVYNLMISAF